MQAELERILKEFGADTGSIHRLEGDRLLLEAQIGLPPVVVETVKIVPVGKGMAGLAAERNAAVDSCNIQTDATGNVRSGARATGVNGAIVVPIRDENGNVRGTLGIAVFREHQYTAEETERLQAVANQLFRS